VWTALVALLASPAVGGEPANPYEEADESALFKFDEDLVTVASRYAETTRQAPSIVTVITASDLRERGCRTLSDALRQLPGIYVWKSPEGRDLAVFRGVIAPDDNKILLLVDGVPWYDGVYTHAWIDDYLPIANVRQIEVIKGPGSAIYGTNAFAGVINVVTWGPDELDGARVRMTGGSGARVDVTGMAGGSARIGGREATAVATVRVMSQDGLGIDVEPDGDPNALGEDPKRGIAVGARLSYAGFEVQLDQVDYRHTYLIRQNADTPLGVVGTDIDTTGIRYHDAFFDLVYHAKLGQYGSLSPHVWSQRHDDPGDYWFGDTLVQTVKDTRRAGVGVDADVRPWVDHHTVGGAGVETTTVLDLKDVRYDATNPEGIPTGFGVPASGDHLDRLCNLYGYAQHTWVALPGIEIVGGGRLDHRFGCGVWDPGTTAWNLTPRGGVLLVPSDAVTAKILYGTAFRDPTVREVMVAAPVDADSGRYTFTSADDQLDPERIQTAEAELDARVTAGLQLRGDAFWSRLANEINIVDRVRPDLPDGTVVPDGPQYTNLGGALQVVGLEAEVVGTAGPVRTTGSIALTNAVYSGGLYDGLRQYELPPWMAKGSVRLSASDRYSATLFGELYGERPRAAWSADGSLDDGPVLGLLHAAVRARDLGPDGRAEVDVSVYNVLDSPWNTGVYRDDAVEPGIGSIAGQGRRIDVSVEVGF
jgi:outer membrane receptor protein involved in Fe transport